jgi:hypothetical protein
MYIYIHTFLGVYVCIYIHAYIHTYILGCVCVCVCVCACACACALCLCVCYNTESTGLQNELTKSLDHHMCVEERPRVRLYRHASDFD